MHARRVPPLVVMTLLLAPAFALAQQKPTTQPTDFVIPELRFDKIGFDDVMEFMGDVVPGFQVQLLRDPGVPADYPTVTFRAKEVTTRQMMDFFTSAYGVEWEQIEGPRGSIFIARLRMTERVVAQLQKAGRPSGNIRMYSLAAIAPGTKDPMADVLSIIQAAVEQSGVPKPTLKVHESTRMLMVTGDPAALAVVDGVLAALRPSQDDVRRQYDAKLQEAQQAIKLKDIEFESRLRSAEMERGRMQDAMANEQKRLEMEIQQLRARLAQPGGAPAAKP